MHTSKFVIFTFIMLSSLSLLFALPGDLRWEYKTGGSISCGFPAIADSLIYFGNYQGFIFALNTATGTCKWSRNLGIAIESQPAVSEGIVYLGSWSNYLYAMDALNGDIKWNYRTGDIVISSPCVSEKTVFFGSWDHYFYAINCSDGSLKWRYQTGGYIYSSPCVSGSLVYFGSKDKRFYALNKYTGELEWLYETGDALDADPRVSDGVFYCGSSDTYLYALNAYNGSLKWKFKTKMQVPSSPFIVDNLVYIGAGSSVPYIGYIYAINTPDGSLKWTYQTNGGIWSSPYVSKGIVYVGGGGKDTCLYAINASNGNFIWKYETGAHVNPSPVVSDKTVYFGSYDYYFYAVEIGDLSLKLFSPNGGEKFGGGSVHEIKWGSFNVDSVYVRYTIDGGTSWIDIDKVKAEPGSYNWTVPNTPSTYCLVEVSDVKGRVFDISDTYFTIYYVGFSDNKKTNNLPSPSFSISPNPFTSRLALSLPSSGAVYSLTGQLIMKLDKGKHSLDTNKWKQGVYIVKSGKETKRIVKIN